MAPSATNGDTKQAEDEKSLPFQGKQPYGMPDDLVVPNVMDIDGTDDRLWVSNDDIYVIGCEY